ALHEADHVFFQSEFCRLSSSLFLGERQGPSEVLHNPVDTERFAPGPRRRDGLTLLLGGNQYQRYRLESALETLSLLPDARLLVSGALSWHPDRRRSEAEGRELVSRLGLEERVELLGSSTQDEAPERLDDHAEAARARALRFDLRPWVERHRQVFEELVR